MSDQLPASRGADELQPPATTGTYAGTVTASTATAAELDLSAKLPRGGAWFSFQARGGDVYVRFRATTAAGSTTAGNASTGLKIADGTRLDVWLTPNTKYVDHAASATCSLFWWQSSPNYDNR